MSAIAQRGETASAGNENTEQVERKATKVTKKRNQGWSKAKQSLYDCPPKYCFAAKISEGRRHIGVRATSRTHSKNAS